MLSRFELNPSCKRFTDLSNLDQDDFLQECRNSWRPNFVLPGMARLVAPCLNPITEEMARVLGRKGERAASSTGLEAPLVPLGRTSEMEKIMRVRLLVGTIAAIALIGCSREDADDVEVQNGVVAQSNAPVASDAAPIAASEFVAKAAASDLYEIESGKIAVERATNAQVKSFAAMLVTDHQKSTDALKSAASQAKPRIEVRPVLDAEEQAMIDALKSSNGADFDRTFIDQQKQAHQKALELMGQYRLAGDSPELKSFAEKTGPVVQAHLGQLNSMRP